jgi:hypothetical protein
MITVVVQMATEVIREIRKVLCLIMNREDQPDAGLCFVLLAGNSNR